MRASLLAIALVLALSGCGGDDTEPPGGPAEIPSLSPTGSTDPSGSASPTKKATPQVSASDARAARRAFDTWLGAFADGNGARACPLQTKKFTEQQVKRLAAKDRIERGASCGDLVTIVGILFEALQLDVSRADIARGPSEPDEVAFSVKFKGFATLGYALVKSGGAWRVNEDLTIS
jgi:hypothetical protein